MLPKDIAKQIPRTRLLTEMEWRKLGVQQSQGWVHYMIHPPGILYIHNIKRSHTLSSIEPHILLFRRPITDHEAAKKAREEGW